MTKTSSSGGGRGGLRSFAAVLLAVSSSGAFAVQNVSVVESIKLDAPVARVWELVGHFDSLAWHPAVKSTEASEGDKIGSQRRLDLGGPILWEELISRRTADHTCEYKILDNGSNQKILPVSHYVASIEVRPSGAGSEVVWRANFQPVEGADAAAAHKIISGIFRSGLDALPQQLAIK